MAFLTISGVRLCWELEEPKGPKESVGPHPIGGNLVKRTCLSSSNLLTSVHWGKPLHVFGLTSEVSGSSYELDDGIPLWAFSRLAGPGACET